MEPRSDHQVFTVCSGVLGARGEAEADSLCSVEKFPQICTAVTTRVWLLKSGLASSDTALMRKGEEDPLLPMRGPETRCCHAAGRYTRIRDCTFTFLRLLSRR